MPLLSGTNWKSWPANEKATGEYLRPLILIQAQPHNKNKPTLTTEVVKETLMNDHHIPEDQIAIATGQTRKLDDVDLFGATRSGSSLPCRPSRKAGIARLPMCFARWPNNTRPLRGTNPGTYLRMPRRQKKTYPDLNVAYAFAASSSFIDTAKALGDALIESGFHKLEARDFVVGPEVVQQTFDDFSMFGTTTEIVSETPNLAGLEPALRDRVTFDETTKTLTVVGILSDSDHRPWKCASRRRRTRKRWNGCANVPRGRKRRTGRRRSANPSACRG